MQKRALVACLLVVAMLLSGCSLIKKDMDVDAATPILTVGDTVFTKAEIQSAVNEYLQQLQSYYSQYYGYSIDITDASIVADAQSHVIEDLTEQTVIANKAKELGVDTLSEEDQAEVDEDWSYYYDLIKNAFYADSEMTEEELEAAVNADVATYFGVTKDSLVASKVQELVRAEAVKNVTVSDEQIQTEFDSRVESAKTSYESNLSSYGSSFNAGSIVYYRPAGYRLVKQILTKFTSDDQALMDDIDSKISTLNTTISTLQSTLSDVEDLDALLAKVTVTLEEVTEEAEETEATEATEATEETEETEESAETETAAVTTAPDYNVQTDAIFDEDTDETVKANVIALKEAQEKLAKYVALQTEAKAKAYADIDARADEILEELAAGADWDTLMSEKTEDPGMQSGSDTAVTGYAVCENMSGFDSAFVDAAMALENVGDYTGKVASDLYGYYIIQYTADVEEGPVALEGEVYDTIKSDLQSTYEDEAYEEAVQQWIAATKVTTDLKSLNN